MAGPARCPGFAVSDLTGAVGHVELQFLVRAHPRVSSSRSRELPAARKLLPPPAVLHKRPTRIRGLRLYEGRIDEPLEVARVAVASSVRGGAVFHARSRFRSLADPDRYALYSHHDATPSRGLRFPTGSIRDHHTLIVVREFRRVPLNASALGLILFTARPGHAAPVVAAVAHFVERAVSVYQPSYLLLAHSLEAPQLAMLITGVHECAALAAARDSAFSIDALLPELRPMLAGEPEVFAYCPERVLEEAPRLVSPYAV